jgi:sugar phosphate isomerase/epimerase
MPGFQYCLNSSTIQPTPILDKIRIAANVGYSAIELWHDDIDAYLATGGTLADIRKAVEDAGLSVPTSIYLKGWFETEGAEHARALEECKRRLNQAAKVGAQHIIAGPPAGKADHELGARNYRELLELGKEFGVKPALEYLGFVEEFNCIEDALDVVARSGHSDATIVHDPFHIFRGGGSFDAVSSLSADQIAIFHFNDAPASPSREEQHDADRVMPGDGILELKALLASLRDIGYDRWLSLELFREDLWQQDPEEVARG